MSLIVLASDKGSPGVTTTAVALAGVWPRRAVLAECDPAGGDLVYRTPADSGQPLNPNIGMLSLATTARHGLSPHQLEQHIQRMHGGLELVVGLATGDQSAGLAGLWPALGRAFDALPEADVIADCGRVDAAGPALDLMATAALVVLVARTSAEQIAHVRDRALSLLQRVGGGTATAGGGLGVPIGVVLIVDPKQRARVTAQVDELLRTSGLPVKVIGTIADDPDGADLINGRGRGRLDRTLLIRSTREVALDLYRRFAMPSQGAAIPQGAAPMMPPGQPIPGPQQQYAAPPIQQPLAPPMPPQPQYAPPMPPPQAAPVNGYAQPARPAQPIPPAPTAKPPMFRRDAQAQPAVWPSELPPKPPTSAHEGFTSVTLGGGPDPRPGNLPYQDARESDLNHLPPGTDIQPGRHGHRAAPPQEDGGRH
ncbi:hypothetical protein ABH935_006921 [Catenulispora sp. GAS73]|uniref:hypothetical protein n=1 Tax=Catenulispora sp. GAS73 TaxID=3156269 RepID=UPI003515F5A7